MVSREVLERELRLIPGCPGSGLLCACFELGSLCVAGNVELTL